MRTSQQDWIDAGIRLLREEGEYALTTQRLCETLEMTKGSFYHHFKDLNTYQIALLEWWETALTSTPINLANQESNPKKRAKKLTAIVQKLDHQLDLSIRAWGLHNHEVRAFVQRVDQRRLESLIAIQNAFGNPRADVLAQLEYVAFVGAQQLGLVTNALEFQLHLAKSLTLLAEELNAKPTT